MKLFVFIACALSVLTAEAQKSVPVYDAMTGWRNQQSSPFITRTTGMRTSIWFLTEYALNGQRIDDPNPEWVLQMAGRVKGLDLVVLDIETLRSKLVADHPDWSEAQLAEREGEIRKEYYTLVKKVVGPRTLVIQYNTHQGAGVYSDAYLFSSYPKWGRDPMEVLGKLQRRLDARTRMDIPAYVNTSFVMFNPFGKNPEYRDRVTDSVLPANQWRELLRGAMALEVDGVVVWFGKNPGASDTMEFTHPGVQENYWEIRQELLLR